MSQRTIITRGSALCALAGCLLWLAQPGLALARPTPVPDEAEASVGARLQVKRVAVAAFAAPAESRARQAVLEALSEHDDVEVVSLEDIAMAGRRVQADPTKPSGRRKLSEELGIDAWIDGKVADDSAQVTMHTPQGRSLAVANVEGDSSDVIDRLIGPQTWAALGPWLSAREQRLRAISQQQDLALQKALAREQELERQRALLQARAQARTAQLRAAQGLALAKRLAYSAELARQRGLVAQRAGVVTGGPALQSERERAAAAAAEAEFQASLLDGAAPTSAPHAAPHTGSVWAAIAPAPVGVSPAQPTRAARGERSPASARLLAQRGGQAAAPRTPDYAPQAPRAAAARADGVVSIEGVSPATRLWLEQQQVR